MLRGIVNEGLEPLVPLGLLGVGKRPKEIWAILDTGFSGHLCLSEKHAGEIALEYAFTDEFELADGRVVIEEVFRGRVIFDGQEREVFVIFTASEDSLIGAALLRDYVVRIDYPKRVVTLRRRRTRKQQR